MFTYDELIASSYLLLGDKLTADFILQFLKNYFFFNDAPYIETKLKDLKDVFYLDVNSKKYKLVGNIPIEVLASYLNVNLLKILIMFKDILKVDLPSDFELKRNLINIFTLKLKENLNVKSINKVMKKDRI